MKADRESIDILHKVKTNKIDTEMIKDVQIMMSKQFKQILVLFVEMVNCQTAKLHESKHTYEGRIDNLVHQAQTLSKWVLLFDPVAVMNPSDVNSVKFMDDLDEKIFTDFSL